MNSGILVFALSVLGTSSMAFAGASLCEKNEAVFFNCTVQSGKIVSLCGDKRMLSWSSDLSYDPFLTYRYGNIGKLELEYPKKRDGSTNKFRYLHMASHVDMGNYDLDEVSFQISHFEYTVYENTLPPPDGETVNSYQSGVSVSQKKAKGLVSICKGHPESNIRLLEPFLGAKVDR